MNKPILYTHRGVSGHYPENTMIAFRATKLTDVTGIELDVQQTKDGEIVIIHDETVDRTTNGSGYIRDYLYEDLKKLDAGKWFHDQFAGVRIPSLEEFFQWATEDENDFMINVELKNDLLEYQGMEEKVLFLISKYQLEERIIISSFNWNSLKLVRKLHPTIKIGCLVAGCQNEAIIVAKEIQAEALHIDLEYAYSKYSKLALENDLLLRLYTINDPNEMKTLSVPIHTIMTDFPEKFLTEKV